MKAQRGCPGSDDAALRRNRGRFWLISGREVLPRRRLKEWPTHQVSLVSKTGDNYFDFPKTPVYPTDKVFLSRLQAHDPSSSEVSLLTVGESECFLTRLRFELRLHLIQNIEIKSNRDTDLQRHDEIAVTESLSK